MKTPIILTAHNRPEYLKSVIESLIPQCEDREVWCFVDGPRYKEDVNKVIECYELCQKMLPKAKTLGAERNLGVAVTMRLAREKVFEDNEFLILIEDDSILQPHYIKQLDMLIEKFKDDERVAMINCFGEHHRSKSSHRYSYINYTDDLDLKTPYREQQENKDKLILMDHLWAYAMRRSSYEKIYDIMEGYWRLLPREYRARPHQLIHEHMSKFGIDPNKIVSSQDSCTSSAFAARGMIKLSTFTNNFEYIGATGEHSRPEFFKKAGWHDQDVYDKYQEDFIWNEEIRDEIKQHIKKKYLK
jgi:glycosyltransferase involved in cell wall biosynthesis